MNRGEEEEKYNLKFSKTKGNIHLDNVSMLMLLRVDICDIHRKDPVVLCSTLAYIML